MTTSTTFRTIGLDLGDKKHKFCVLEESGDILRRGSLHNKAEHIQKLVEDESRHGNVRIALESGTHSPWISRLLEKQHNCEILVGNARKIRAIWQNDRKDDHRDAEMLARIARFDPQLLSPIRHRSEQAQADLAVIRARDTLVKARTELINSVRGMVKSFGAKLPKCSAPSFAKKVFSAVPCELRPAVEPMLAQIAELSAKIRAYDQKIEQLSKERYPETALIRQPAGVGPVTALAYVLVLEDPNRFEKSRQVGPFLGLVPKRDQSSEQEKELSISKAGDELLRRLLSQAAHYIMGPFGPDCDLRRHGMKIMNKGGKNPKGRAVTAVARKLAVLLHSLWKNNAEYQPFYGKSKGDSNSLKPAA